MFTGNLVGLDEFASEDLSVVRDCRFAYVGKVPTRLAPRLVPCGRKDQVSNALAETGIAGVVTTPELADGIPPELGLATAADPLAACMAINADLVARPDFQWTDFETRIDPSAIVEPGALIAPRNVRIGAHSRISSGAIVRERSVIGEHCRIGPGVVVGCDAYEVDMTSSPRRIVAQAGGVLLEDFVEIEAKSTIVRATFGGFTRLGGETKLDCQVHVAHDCDIGQRVRITACSTISGRVAIGDDAYLGPNCTISNGLRIGEGAFVTLGSVVVRDVDPGERVTGHFAIPHRKWLAFLRSIR